MRRTTTTDVDDADDDRLRRLRALVERTRPVSLAEERVLPVLPAVETFGLRRGTVVGVQGGSGATALALALTAGPTRSGSWAAFVGLPELGWAAAGELGVELDHVVLVRPTERTRATVVAALVDAFDVVVCGFDGALSATEVRRLTARVRERGSVLLVVGGRPGGAGRSRRAWPAATDVELTVVESVWTGPHQGAGHLRERRLTVEVGGRRALARPRRVGLLLPDRTGGAAAAEDVAPDARAARVVPLRRVG